VSDGNSDDLLHLGGKRAVGENGLSERLERSLLVRRKLAPLVSQFGSCVWVHCVAHAEDLLVSLSFLG
jgi:hypothetical protein